MRISDSQRSLLELLLTPLVRYFFRKSLTIQTFYDIAKTVYVAVAVEEFSRAKEEINVSRISAATGVTRNEVTRIYKKQELPTVRTGMSIASRVMGQWELDSRFCSRARKPRVLTYVGEASEFAELVRSVSKTLNSRTVFRELERIGAVTMTRKGVRLVKDVDRSEDEERWRIELAAQDMDLLLQAVDENITRPQATRNHHVHTEADNVFKELLPDIRLWIEREATKFHKRMREYLAKQDADFNKGKSESGESGQKVVFSSFSFTSRAD